MHMFLFLLLPLTINSTPKNNVCKEMKDYYAMDKNPNCWYDDSINKRVPDVIKDSGRPVEEYTVATSDGYILTVFRMMNTGRKNPVFLQHGLIASSANWISLGNNSLAFQLYDSGFDVWMGNYRGTEYSEGHVNYTTDDDEYWNYSMDDVALKDIPTILELISKETNHTGGVIYIGHSLGTTFGLMYSSEFPEKARKQIKLMILTAPAYTLGNMITPLRVLVPFSELILYLITQLGLIKFVSREKTTKGILKLICLDSPLMMERCSNALNLIYGPRSSISASRIPQYFYQHPSGTSIKLVKQASDLGKQFFRKYDYGPDNIRIYGSNLPPDYDIGKIEVPTVIIYAKHDWLTTKTDAMNLYKRFPKNFLMKVYEIQENFNHIDFMFGENSKRLYVDYVMDLLNKNLPT